MKNSIACGYTIPITLFGIPPSPENHLKSIEIVGRAGFREMELELYDELIPEHVRDLKKMQAALNRFGIIVPSVMAVEETMFSMDCSRTLKSVSDFDAISDLVCALGAPLITICGYMPPELRPVGTGLYTGGPPTRIVVNDDFSWPFFWDHAVQLVNRLAEIAKSKGLNLLIETRTNDWFGSVDSIINLIDQAGSDNLGVILDVAHVHAGKEYLALAVRKLATLIQLVHLSDNDSTHAYHLPPGKGNIDFQALFHALHIIGYEGTMVIDISGVENIIEEAIVARDFFSILLEEEK